MNGNAMTDPDHIPFADCDVIRCCSRATLFDKHLASTVHCADDEIISWLRRRETKPRGLPGRDIEQSHLI
jgi:hypothetical protein